MDLLKLIKSKSSSFSGTQSQQGLDAVIHHIEIAELHFEQGRENGEHLFTDVIYRSNQAFEGALKEAYRVLNSSDPARKTPFQIEQYFESSNVLKERVLNQFTNYRTEWRNKSTHDYQLFFSSQEALLAIVSVSAFFNILLDQMLEKHAYEMEKARLSHLSKSVFSDVDNYESLGFMQQCIELLTHFSAELSQELDGRESPREYELLGKLSGFISAADPEIKIATEKAIDHASGKLRLDLLLEKGESSVIVEMKRPSIEWKRRAREGLEQLRHYLIATKLVHGIVFVPSINKGAKLEITERTLEAPHGDLHTVMIGAPTMLHRKMQPTQ
ncbi:hypothetical protein ACU8V4_03495 [Pseudoalteromonas mariniglutinosa]